MNLAAAFDTRVALAPEHPALFWGTAEWSYRQLRTQSELAAHELARRTGLRPGDRVALWLRNSPDFVAVLLGALRLGAVVVPINNFFKPAEVQFIVKDAGIRTLVADASVAEHFPALQAACPELCILDAHHLGSSTATAPVPCEPVTVQPVDLALIVYTSGTTGRPKGAMLSHANLLHNVESCRQVVEASPEDRMVVLLPLFHSFMLCVGVLLPLITGGSIVLIRSLHPPKAVVEELIRHRGTILPAIPQFFRALAAMPPEVTLPVRLCVSGAAPLPAQILAEFEARFAIPLLEGYGLSEASPVVSMNPMRGPWKPGSIGVPIPNVELSVQDDHGRLLAPGEVGELCVRGGNVMEGYWRQPEETERVLRHGWLLTGDVGYRDSEGYFFITDRKKDMVLVNGINVYPREIEEVLYRFPGIKEAAVVGVPSARKGEQPVAYVAADEGIILDQKAVLEFVHRQMADYKVPRQVIQLPALPRNATGKILKTDLRRLAAKDPVVPEP